MIRDNIRKLLEELPPGVELVAAAKTRTPDEVLSALDAGVGIIGENYIQEAVEAAGVVGGRAKMHFIGHLQKNKVKRAVELFDMIETVDSLSLAQEIDKHCRRRGKVMSILIEINSGREAQKFGVFPEDAIELIKSISLLENVGIKGLMTMGPRFGSPEEARPYFIETKKLYDHIKVLDIPGVEMKSLSMGMSNSYQVAVEEGANIIRVGTMIFGEREG
ncbi:MAG: YggS family pyridoxal phosphate-dependent enzyme [Dehalococcoidia bacterium]|nr:YggS family pyridoxal phosphate-dependent enzyme [Dehalococcoidia bacterium]